MQKANEQLKTAFEHFRQLTDSGDANAQFATGYCYYYGVGVKKDTDFAAKTLTAAVNAGCTNAMVLLGVLYQYGWGAAESKSNAVEPYRQAAELGNKQAQYRLACCYKHGIDVDRDDELADFWYERAAAQGHSGAAYHVGFRYEYVDGIERNESKAFQYCRQSAIGGDMLGQYETGKCYHGGIGTQRNYRKAAHWYQKAADQGDKDAAKMVFDCLKRIKTMFGSFEGADDYVSLATRQTPHAINLQHELGFLVAKLATAGSCANAFVLLGGCYFSGVGTTGDVLAAARSYHQAYQHQPALLSCEHKLNLVAFYQNGYVDGASEIDAFALLQQVTSMLRGEINAMLKQTL